MLFFHPLRRVVAACALAALTLPAHAGLGFDEAARIAAERAPALLAQRQSLAGAEAAAPAADTLPDPRLAVGVENLNIAGADRYSLNRDGMTMQRIALMQEVPNRAKRAARAESAQALVVRERARLAAAALAVRRDAALAWIAVWSAERTLARFDALDRDNAVLQQTLDSRIAAGKAMPAERAMARQDAIALADRRDDAVRDLAKARAALRRWVGERADEPLAGAPPAAALQPDALRADIHRHAEIAPYEAMEAMALADAHEADADRRGDWSWEVAYQRRGTQFGDMVSFQLSFDLPWQTARRQEPLARARRLDAARVAAERADLLLRHAEETEGWLAELASLQHQQQRLAASGRPLAAERVALAMAAYEAGRGDLGAVLAARRESTETELRAIDLEGRIAALGTRLTTQVAED
ncbi:MAG: TolC family protein [Burkholderiales bacterium]|nr:TolC family protein [Burkholderiales bacterium]